MDKLDSILSPEATIERSNELNRKIGAILSERDRKIRKMPPEEKRASVLDTTDEETLNCWAQEENFALRILALSNPHISPGILHQTVLNVGASDLYTLHIVANNPSAASETLALIADFGCNNNEIKYDLLRHPNSGTLLKLRLSEGSEAGQ
ncbi:MAG: hypothetical protein LBS45_09335 [Synergistaceae bacterium]|nr:hypothetical protein [Synergistaceae bacterium]